MISFYYYKPKYISKMINGYPKQMTVLLSNSIPAYSPPIYFLLSHHDLHWLPGLTFLLTARQSLY